MAGKNKKESFKELCEGLDVNDRVASETYNSYMATVFVAKIVNPRSGKIQYRIELKMDDEFKPYVVIKGTTHFNELKRFVEWLEKNREYLEVLDELNDSVKVVKANKVAKF